MKQPKQSYPFVKYHTGLSYMFTPAESRFILHMLDAEFIKSCGYCTDWSKTEYMKRMGLTEHLFDKCVKNLQDLKLLTKEYNQLGNRVYYTFNIPLYNKLVEILSATNDVDKLISFCENFRKEKREIASVSEKEIQDLKSHSKLQKEYSYNRLPEPTSPAAPIQNIEQLIPLCKDIITLSKQMQEIITTSPPENVPPST